MEENKNLNQDYLSNDIVIHDNTNEDDEDLLDEDN